MHWVRWDCEKQNAYAMIITIFRRFHTLFASFQSRQTLLATTYSLLHVCTVTVFTTYIQARRSQHLSLPQPTSLSPESHHAYSLRLPSNGAGLIQIAQRCQCLRNGSCAFLWCSRRTFLSPYSCTRCMMQTQVSSRAQAMTQMVKDGIPVIHCDDVLTICCDQSESFVIIPP